MEPLSRRAALQLGGLGLGSAAVGGFGLWSSSRSGSSFPTASGAAFLEPPVLRSVGGGLRVTLEAREGPVRIGGRGATALSYNGGTPGPTLHLQPGDRLQVRLINRLSDPTNLHVHGLHVSPEGHGDNVLIAVQPGASWDYDYQLPSDHPSGVYWYHPHHHGMVAEQVFGGLYGAIIVGDPPHTDSGVAATRERVLVISDTSLDGAGRVRPTSQMARMQGREGDLLLLNGQTQPVLTGRPGERERWRIVNACAARYLRLRVDGQQLDLLGIDSGRFVTPQRVEQFVLAPGNRADLLVTLSQGSSELRLLGYDRGSVGRGGSISGTGAIGLLATLRVTGSAGPALARIPAQTTLRDLRLAPLDGRRTVNLAMGMGGGIGRGGMGFTIDGQTFDASRVDQQVRAGAVEEWEIRNTSPMDHPFHLHVWPMQLTESGGVPVDVVSRQDVFNVPARSSVKVRIAFETFTGRTVYHCHILDHEDLGMMGVIDVR
jgi:FtsP/CotA-like multicopper oxidase with cupredoxin domain